MGPVSLLPNVVCVVSDGVKKKVLLEEGWSLQRGSLTLKEVVLKRGGLRIRGGLPRWVVLKEIWS